MDPTTNPRGVRALSVLCGQMAAAVEALQTDIQTMAELRDALRAERDKLIEILRAERAHGFRERDQLRADRDQAQADYARAQQVVRGQSAANVLLTQEAQRLRAELAAIAEHRDAERDQSQAEAAANVLLTEERDRLRDALSVQSDTLTHERADTSRRIHALVQERDQLRADLAAVTAQRDRLTEERARLTSEANARADERDAALADRDAAQAELRAWNADREEWRAKAAPTPKPPTACGRTWGTNCMRSPGAAHVCRDVSGHDELCCCSCCGAVGLVRKQPPDQPAPSGGTGDCWQELISHAEAEGYPQPLLDAMAARRALGIERYGQPLRRGDGRDHRRDLAEELLDAAVYAYADGTTIAAFDVLELAVRVVR